MLQRGETVSDQREDPTNTPNMQLSRWQLPVDHELHLNQDITKSSLRDVFKVYLFLISSPSQDILMVSIFRRMKMVQNRYLDSGDKQIDNKRRRTVTYIYNGSVGKSHMVQSLNKESWTKVVNCVHPTLFEVIECFHGPCDSSGTLGKNRKSSKFKPEYTIQFARNSNGHHAGSENPSLTKNHRESRSLRVFVFSL
jgi:hypothetical protein